jgi:hypothetical protein
MKSTYRPSQPQPSKRHAVICALNPPASWSAINPNNILLIVSQSHPTLAATIPITTTPLTTVTTITTSTATHHHGREQQQHP